METIGDARVSTDGETLEAENSALRELAARRFSRKK